MQLGVSVHTAHTYTKALYRKLGVHSRGELMARARRSPV
jgi:DNA-binding CsgD family transcriptional regulator